MKVIITDSTADFPASYKENSGIKVVPLNVHIDNTTFREGLDISNQEYYSRLRSEPIFPQTSQPSAGEFLKIFKELKPGDEALVILISSKISGTVQSATMAKDMFNNEQVRIEIIDSLSTVAGLGFQVMKACELVQENKKMDEIIKVLEIIREKTKILFVVDDLEYLARGGRISHVSKRIGNILQVKPVLSLIGKGQIEPYEKVRTKSKAVAKIIEEFKKDSLQAEKLSILHVDSPREAGSIYEEIKKFYSGSVIVTEPGPVIGSHVGPGTVGLAWY